jgi:hypothetical protein
MIHLQANGRHPIRASSNRKETAGFIVTRRPGECLDWRFLARSLLQLGTPSTPVFAYGADCLSPSCCPFLARTRSQRAVAVLRDRSARRRRAALAAPVSAAASASASTISTSRLARTARPMGLGDTWVPLSPFEARGGAGSNEGGYCRSSSATSNITVSPRSG